MSTLDFNTSSYLKFRKFKQTNTEFLIYLRTYVFSFRIIYYVCLDLIPALYEFYVRRMSKSIKGFVSFIL